MNILSKVNVKQFTYILIFLSIITGQFKLFSMLFLMIFVHEIGHVIVSRLFGWKINKINIYPFGGVITYDISLNENIWVELLVTLAGPFFQLIFTIIIFNLGIFSQREALIYKNLSYSLLFFNLLPIVPLDGSKLLFLFFNKVTSYNKSHIVIIYVSLITIFLLIIKSLFNLTFYSAIIFLIVKVYFEIKNHNIIVNRFLLERHLYSKEKGRIKVIKRLNPKNIWKNRINLFLVNNNIIKEGDVLSMYFKGKLKSHIKTIDKKKSK